MAVHARVSTTRAAVAAGDLDRSFDQVVGGAAPEPIGWIDDLGLRRFESAGRQRVPRAGELGDLLVTIVDEHGGWDEAAALAGRTLPQLQPASSRAEAAGLARVGNVLAVSGDARCLHAWQLIVDGDVPAALKALAIFRMLVAHVKRLDSTPSIIEQAFVEVESAMTELGSPGDRRILAALVGNLHALLHVRARRGAEATQAVRSAWAQVAHDRDEPVELSIDLLDEVRLQVLANVATVCGASGDWDEAADLLQRGIAIAERRGSDAKLMEAHCLHGYALWNAGEASAARVALHAADEAADRVGATTQRRQTWKVLAVLEEDAGNHEARDRWLAQLAASDS